MGGGVGLSGADWTGLQVWSGQAFDQIEKQREIESDLGSSFSVLNLKLAHLRGKGKERHSDRAGGVFTQPECCVCSKTRENSIPGLRGRKFKRFGLAEAAGKMERGAEQRREPHGPHGQQGQRAGTEPGRTGRRAGRAGVWPRPQLTFLSLPERESRGRVRVGGAVPREEAG